ncbi:murein hydrolase activator EnvC family protein [Euzebya pacifica]|nr:M23 family metallopeptidase [Euzebya pacifica]
MVVRRVVVVPCLLVVAVLLVFGGPTTVAAVPLEGTPAPPAGGVVVDGPTSGTGAIRPVPGRVVRFFDPPEHPYGPGHRGVDLAAEPGDAVRAVLSGTVAFAGPVADRGWVTVDHGGGLRTTYGDLVPSVEAGATVLAGEVVGHLAEGVGHLDWGARLARVGDGGSTGSAGAGDYIDPLSLLERWRPHLTSPDRVPRGRVVDL